MAGLTYDRLAGGRMKYFAVIMTSSMNGVVVYNSRYGATQQYAEWIGAGLKIPVIDPERLDDRVLAACDFLLIGTSVYIGKMLIKDWLRKNEQHLRNKKLFVFVVCSAYSDVEKQQQIVKDNIPEGIRASSDIFFLPGRLSIKNLSLMDGLALKLGARLEKDPLKKEAMEQDSDAVKKENLDGLLGAVKEQWLKVSLR